MASTVPAAPAASSIRSMPTPGAIRWTITRPMVSETSEALMNQAMVLTPTRPMLAASSMWAMPATRVENTRGAMIILIRRRKTSVMMVRLPATSLACSGLRPWFTPQPTATPSTMAATMKAVKRRFMKTPGRSRRPLSPRMGPFVHSAAKWRQGRLATFTGAV